MAATCASVKYILKSAATFVHVFIRFTKVKNINDQMPLPEVVLDQGRERCPACLCVLLVHFFPLLAPSPATTKLDRVVSKGDALFF